MSNKIAATVSGLKHPSTSMLTVCSATWHIVHGMVTCFKYSVWAGYVIWSTSPFHLERSLYPLPYNRSVSIYDICFMLSNTCLAKTGNALCWSRSSNFQKGSLTIKFKFGLLSEALDMNYSALDYQQSGFWRSFQYQRGPSLLYSFLKMWFRQDIQRLGVDQKISVWAKRCFDLCVWCADSFMSEKDAKSYL